MKWTRTTSAQFYWPFVVPHNFRSQNLNSEAKFDNRSAIESWTKFESTFWIIARDFLCRSRILGKCSKQHMVRRKPRNSCNCLMDQIPHARVSAMMLYLLSGKSHIVPSDTSSLLKIGGAWTKNAYSVEDFLEAYNHYLSRVSIRTLDTLWSCCNLTTYGMHNIIVSCSW